MIEFTDPIKCPKCLALQVTKKFHNSCGEVEHIDCACQVCRYSFKSATADAKKEVQETVYSKWLAGMKDYK